MLRAAFFLNKPILMGILSLASVLFCCQAYGGAVHQSYGPSSQNNLDPVISQIDIEAFDAAEAPHPRSLPLLFLSFVGLAGMALSQTGSSKDDRD